jgi:hypothetical protein
MLNDCRIAIRVFENVLSFSELQKQGDIRMDTNAKKVHGTFLYNATWANQYPLVFFLALGRCLLFVCKFQMTEACLSTASSFYSACGYATREKKGTKKKLLIMVGGGGAICFALLAVFCKSIFTIHKRAVAWTFFQPTELDVMGSIFTQAKFYQYAHYCFWNIQDMCWVDDKTIALSCKWYAKQPCHRPQDVENLKRRVVKLVHLHPEWDETILARLWDFVGEEKKAIESRRIIARKVADGSL